MQSLPFNAANSHESEDGAERATPPPYPPTLIWRHNRENLKKCTLRAVESRKDLHFFSYPRQTLPDLTNYLLLTLDGSPLTPADSGCGLLLIDGTWRYAEKMLRALKAGPNSIPPDRCRSVKGYLTAYPRYQVDCQEPSAGLASIEALFLAYHALGREAETLLKGYYWATEFLERNGLDEKIDRKSEIYYNSF